MDGTLGENDRRELEAHLAECADCRAKLAEARAMRDLVKRGEYDIPDGLHERIMRAVAAEPKKAPKKSRAVLWRRISVAAACMFICAVACVGSILMPMMKSNAEAPSPSTTEAEVSESFTEDIGESEVFPTDKPGDHYDPEEEGVVENTAEADPVPPFNGESADRIEESFPGANNEILHPEHSAPNAEGADASRPGGDEITLALLIVSGLLAVASFVAFLISLSSVRSGRSGKDNE